MMMEVNGSQLSVSTDERLQAAIALWQRFVYEARGTRMGLVYHSDLDGVLGAAYMKRAALSADCSVIAYCVSTDEYDFSALNEWIWTEQPTNCLFSDIALENSPAILNNIASHVSGQIFIYDHHYVTNDEPLPRNVWFANPTPKLIPGQTHIPTFAFAHEIARALSIPFPDWLVVLAIFAEGVQEFYETDLSVFGGRAFGAAHTNFDRNFYRESGLQRVSTLIRAEFSSGNKSDIVLSLLDAVIDSKVQTLSEFANRLEVVLGPSADRIGSEISQTVTDWRERIDKAQDPGVVVYVPIESPVSISGSVASILRGAYPDKVVVAFQEKGLNTVVELRTRNDTTLRLPSILRSVGQRVPLVNSGGHPSAAGALVATHHLDEFLRVLAEEVDKACH